MNLSKSGPLQTLPQLSVRLPHPQHDILDGTGRPCPWDQNLNSRSKYPAWERIQNISHLEKRNIIFKHALVFWWFLDILVLRRVYQTSNSFTRNLRSVQKNHVWKTYGVTIPMRQFPRFLVQRFHRFPTEWHQNSRSHPSGYWGCGVNELLQVMLQMWVDLSDLNPNKGKARRRHSRHKPQNKWKRNIYIYDICDFMRAMN